MKSDPTNKTGDTVRPAARETYIGPRFFEYGSLSDRTASGSQDGTEGGGVGNMDRKL